MNDTLIAFVVVVSTLFSVIAGYWFGWHAADIVLNWWDRRR